MSDSIASLTSGDSSAAVKRDEIQIQVLNFETDNVYIWSVNKFYDKLETMKDMINREDTPDSRDKAEEDPFSDRAEPLLIGQVFYKLEPLAYLIDNPLRAQELIDKAYSKIISYYDTRVVADRLSETLKVITQKN